MEPCCENPDNRGEVETPNPEKPELTLTRCKVCGRRHFELDLEPMRLGIEMH